MDRNCMATLSFAPDGIFPKPKLEETNENYLLNALLQRRRILRKCKDSSENIDVACYIHSY